MLLLVHVKALVGSADCHWFVVGDQDVFGIVFELWLESFTTAGHTNQRVFSMKSPATISSNPRGIGRCHHAASAERYATNDGTD